MKISLIYTPDKLLLDDHIDPPFGLITVGTILQNVGYDVEIIDMTNKSYKLTYDADVYGISTFTANYNTTLQVLKMIKKSSNAPIIAGGPHASALPQEVLRDGFDAVVVGESEGNIAPIMEAILKGKRGIIQGVSVDNLDSFPYWNYNLVDIKSFNRIVDGEQAFDYMPSRGCPYRCLFCWTAFNPIKVRFHSVERIISELRHNNAKWVRFFDDNFGMNRKHLFELCDVLGKEGIKYRCTPRVTDLTKNVCKALSDSGCLMVNFGVESGSDKMLTIMNKQQTTKQIREGIENAKNVGMQVRIGLVVGFPGETWESIIESVQFLKTIPFDDFNPYLFVPFPGSLPYHQPEKFGITWLSDNWEDYHILTGQCKAHICFTTDELSKGTLLEMWRYVSEELEQCKSKSYQNPLYMKVGN